MKKNKSNLITALVTTFIVMLLYLPEIVKWQFITIIIILVFTLTYLLYELLIDLIKKQYTTKKYIVSTEIIGIIAWAVICYIYFSSTNINVISYYFLVVLQSYVPVAQIIFIVMVYIRGFLKGERFHKNKEMT